MKGWKDRIAYLFLICFFTIPSAHLLFVDKSPLSGGEILFCILFMACGIGLIVMGLCSLKKK